MAKWKYSEVVASIRPGVIFDSEEAYFRIYGEASVPLKSNQVAPYIQQLGDEGWEMVGVAESQPINMKQKIRWVFKKTVD